jgi:predicted transcriptional regulator
MAASSAVNNSITIGLYITCTSDPPGIFCTSAVANGSVERNDEVLDPKNVNDGIEA